MTIIMLELDSDNVENLEKKYSIDFESKYVEATLKGIFNALLRDHLERIVE